MSMVGQEANINKILSHVLFLKASDISDRIW